MRIIQFRNVSWLGLLGLIFTLMAVPAAVAQGRKGKAPEPTVKAAVTAAKVDVNNATQKELEDLPGVGAATAKKIIASRPYASVDDLVKAGVPKSTIAKIAPLVTVGAAPVAAKPASAAPRAKPAVPAATSAQATAAGAKVDINNATEKQLEDLPGVGKATAGKIIAGRPYASVDELAKAGLPKNTIAKIAPLVMVGAAPTRAAKPAPTQAPTPMPAAPLAKTALATKVDINNATQKELEDLPGVGAATAKKIIAGRPYTSVDDMAKAGVPKNAIAKITPLVMVGAAPAAKTAPAAPIGAEKAAPTPVPTPMPAAPTAAPPAKTAAAAQVSYTPPPAAGMVWVNLETKVYHKEGDRWYGKTKNGKYMTEEDAIKAGYRAVKEREKK